MDCDVTLTVDGVRHHLTAATRTTLLDAMCEARAACRMTFTEGSTSSRPFVPKAAIGSFPANNFKGTHMPPSPAVRARGIRKYFGEVIALDGVDLDLLPGQVHGLVGPNGAGKSTLLGLLLGLALADSGRLEILGTPVRRTLALAKGVAGFVDAPGLYPSLTARQNLAALASLRGEHSPEIGDALEQVGLTDVAVRSGVPVGFGVLTCDNEAQAFERAGLPGSREDKGGEAAEAAVATAIALRAL